MDCGSNTSALVQKAVTPARDEFAQDCPDFTAHDLSASVPRRFELIVKRYPDRLAVQSSRHAWTYAVLNRNANRVARSLLSAVGPGCVPVALLFEHGAPVVASILGALKAGKFYAALDPSFPASRNASVLTDLRAPVLMCDRANLPVACELAPSHCRLLVYEDIDETCAPEDPEVTLTAEMPFGVFYTSGSTGQPKGVQWNQNLPLHRVLVDIADIGIDPEDRQTLLTSFTFPVSVADICLSLLNGASLHLYDIGKFGTAHLADWLTQEEITILRTPIALFRHFLSSLGPRASFPTVRSIGLSGATLFRDDVERARAHFPQSCSFVHRYTLSEGGMVTRFVIAADTRLDSTIVPAGYAVDGKSVLILDENRCEVAANEIGEIAIRSRYLPAGYWRQPELNRLRFIPDDADPSSVLVLTGDQGRLRLDGCLELLGRRDHRVKIRGFRIELTAIEAALRQLNNVKDAFVMPQPDASGEMRLVGYVVPTAQPAPAAADLRRLLSATLPHYMLPSAFLFVEAMPLTPNGKVDRNALPRVGSDAFASVRNYDAARNPAEHALVAIWSEVLGLARIGVNDNFFELGGHSLAAARVIARVTDKLQICLPPRSVYDAPTVAELAAMIEKTTRLQVPPPASRNEARAVQETIRRLGMQ